MTDSEAGNANLFMMCEALNTDALTDIPEGYLLRPIRRDELDIWKAIHFDTAAEAEEARPYMDIFYDTVYTPYEEDFYRSCLFLCRSDNDEPVSTCFVWPAYHKVQTIHWFKVKKEYEGHGLGRALLSAVMRNIEPKEFPVFLHTQPTSYRAIKLYTDIGFSFLTDEKVGYRPNHLTEALPYLQAHMPEDLFRKLTFRRAPKFFLDAASSSEFSEF